MLLLWSGKINNDKNNQCKFQTENVNSDKSLIPKDNCLHGLESSINQHYASITINSTLPKYLVPFNDAGPQFVELLILSMINATTLPGHFSTAEMVNKRI